MKKCKLIFKVDGKNRGKVYIGHKWQKDVTEINIHGEPYDYTIEVTQYKRDKNGSFVVRDGEIDEKTTKYKFKRDMV